jgi:hypothetical protein
MVEMARLVAALRPDPVRIEESGGPLPGPEATLAGPTFEEWLRSSS